MYNTLHDDECSRIYTQNQGIFIDVESTEFQRSLLVDIHESYCVELRQKDGFLRIFIFENELDKLDYDFGEWKDSKLIFKN